MSIAARNVDGMIVLSGPIQASEMSAGRKRPGRLATFIRMRRLVADELLRWRLDWP